MLHIQSFVFNAYQENTYILYNQAGQAIVIDPGMSAPAEEKEFIGFIKDNNLTPTTLLNTHCHIDHILGNKFVYDNYGLIPNLHEQEIPILLEALNYASQMGFHYEAAPIPEKFLTEKDLISLGGESLEIRFVPGHSPGHLCFYSVHHGFLIAGDTLFKGSIGRTDLPGGEHQLLLSSIKKELYSLPDEVLVYPGHGTATTIGQEKHHNPFVRG